MIVAKDMQEKGRKGKDLMSYRQIKWLILIIPTLTIGIWEYVRHEYLLPYISMELGNVLSPVIVFLVTILFLTQLFEILERNQKELEEARALKAVHEEREKLAKELHDGIAQTLFLMNVQIDRLAQLGYVDEGLIMQIKRNVHHANSYVRQAIANLREPAEQSALPWMQSVRSLIDEIQRESDLEITLDWRIEDEQWTSKEKIELLAIIREALMNVYKHAKAERVQIIGESHAGGWRCRVIDDGRGWSNEDLREASHRFGIKMMEDRAARMRWRFSMERLEGRTIVTVEKEGTG